MRSRRALTATVMVLLLGGVLFALQPTGAEIPTAGLVLHLPFDGSVVDASPESHVAIGSGITLDGLQFENTLCGQAMTLDGFSGAEVVDHATLRPTSFTISLWARSDHPEWANPFGSGNWLATNQYNAFNFETETVSRYGWSIAPISLDDPRSPATGRDVLLDVETTPESTMLAGITPLALTALDITAWHHYVAVFDAETLTMRVYLDGTLQETVVAAGPIMYSPSLGNHRLSIGIDPNLDAYGEGAIDELRLYDRVLSASEIQALAQECIETPDNTGYGYGNGYGYNSGYGYGYQGGGGGGSSFAGPAVDSGTEPPADNPAEEQAPADAPSQSPATAPASRANAFFGNDHALLKIELDGRFQVEGEVTGQAHIRYTGPQDPSTLRFVLWGPDGTATVLAEGVSEFDWDSSNHDNGVYTLQVEQRLPNGQFRPLQLSNVIAERPIAIRNQVSTASEAMAAAVTGTALALGGMLLSRLTVFAELAKEGAIAYGEDQLRETTDKKRKVKEQGILARLAAILIAGSRFLARIRDASALLVTILLLTVFFTIEGMEQNTWAAFYGSLPVVGIAAVVFGLGALGLEAALARASGSRASLRMYGPGIFSLFVSSVLFRSAFGYPSYVDEVDSKGRSDHLAARIEGLRALALVISIMGVFPIFILLGLWNFDLMQEGLVVGVAGLAGAALPVRPLPGRDIWNWSRPVAVTVFLLAIGMFLAIHLAWLPVLWIFLIGLAGLAVYAWGAIWLLRLPVEEAGDQADADDALRD